MHRMFPAVKPGCPKCTSANADFLHMIWSCPLIQRFWGKIENELAQILEREITLTPRLAILGITFDLGGARGDRILVGVATLLAKRDIAKRWMSPLPPTVKEWRTGMDWTAKMEERVYVARGCPKKHTRVWGKWWEFHGLVSTCTG